MDVAFYFVHWFADLAGAEASPLTGCEKFVLKFPLHLGFVGSFRNTEKKQFFFWGVLFLKKPVLQLVYCLGDIGFFILFYEDHLVIYCMSVCLSR